jgi:hypothetical protein
MNFKRERERRNIWESAMPVVSDDECAENLPIYGYFVCSEIKLKLSA